MAKTSRRVGSRSANRGHRPTDPVPSIEEFLGFERDSGSAFAAGFLGEIYDLFADAEREARRRAKVRALGPDRIVMENGRIDARLQPGDPVTMPYWALKAIFRAGFFAYESWDLPRPRRQGQIRWFRQYRTSLIQWHRYVLISQAFDSRKRPSPGRDSTPTAFETVSRQLEGTSFAGSPKAMQSTYRQVEAALKKGETWRYYRSTSIAFYAQMISPESKFVAKVTAQSTAKSRKKTLR